MAKLFGKSLKSYDDINIDELLETLTEEELEELGTELIDPDDSDIPPSERCRYRTTKAPTGPYDRKALLDFIEKRAREEKDWDEAKPYQKVVRGKVFKAKEQEKTRINDDIQVDTEWDEVLASATEEELVDLAAILGFHGMLNQVQYHQAFVENKDQGEVTGGFQGVAKPENLKVFDDDPPNDVNVDDSLKKIKSNDPGLKEVNLNNVKNISIERLVEFGEALKTNTHVEKLYLSNTKATDKVARAIAASLGDNKTLISLNLESNYITGKAIVEIMEAINTNKTVTEFRIANQRPKTLGNKVEMRIAELVKQNVQIMKLGIFLESPARVIIQEYLQRNNDNVRRGRVGEDLLTAPVPKDYLRRDPVAPKPAATTAAPAPKKPEPEPEEEEDDDDDDDDEDETESSEEEE